MRPLPRRQHHLDGNAGLDGRTIRAALEEASSKTVGVDIGLCYNPEFVALGSVIRDMLYPDMILLGQSDDRAGDVVEAVYRTSTNNCPPVQRMNLINAELVKISVNTYVTTKISYANMLAELCERLPGADVAVVTEALGKDTRIGSKYLVGGLGYGGPCFPRDNVAFSVLAEKLGVRSDLPRATDAINKHQIDRMVAKVRDHVGDCKVAVLGLAYKPDTPVIEESQGVMIARDLAAGRAPGGRLRPACDGQRPTGAGIQGPLCDESRRRHSRRRRHHRNYS